MNERGSMNNHWIKGKNTLNGLQTKSIKSVTMVPKWVKNN